MNIKMKLLSDAIFGNGMSIPGEEDISVQVDEKGFPYYRGGTFKGLFREELERYLDWTAEGTEDRDKEEWIKKEIARLLGEGGNDLPDLEDRLVFEDFCLSDKVKAKVLEEIPDNSAFVTGCLTNIRAFTKISSDGTAEKGSLRFARCVNKGLVFYSRIRCSEHDEDVVREVLSMIRWLGTMRNRGFGKVSFEEEKVQEVQA